MLDDPAALRAALEAYRAAATRAGLAWPDPPDLVPAPPPRLTEYYDVPRIPEQVLWLHSLGLEEVPVLPEGTYVVPWPQSASEALSLLSYAFAVPFRWRRQIPVIEAAGTLFYSVVLDGEHEGEVWRYEISVDSWDSVQAAPSLADLFTAWTTAVSSGVVARGQYDGWLHVIGDGRWQFDVLRRVPDLDLFTYPIAPLEEGPLRERQRSCGVDMTRIEDFETWAALNEEIEALATELDGPSHS